MKTKTEIMDNIFKNDARFYNDVLVEEAKLADDIAYAEAFSSRVENLNALNAQILDAINNAFALMSERDFVLMQLEMDKSFSIEGNVNDGENGLVEEYCRRLNAYH